MTPDQLKYLTDEERRAWEACEAAELPWQGDRNDGTVKYYVLSAHLDEDGDAIPVIHGCNGNEDPPFGILFDAAERFILLASRALPAALEALADARRERDEARALLRSLAESYRGTLVRAPSDHACAECVADKHLSDDAVESGFRCPYHELRAFITPGEDPAPHVAGAPDAAGGALGVGVLTNCDNCANDYMVNGRRQCREVDSLWANFRTEREAADELDGWVAENTDDNGTPLCGATGCPGWAMRGEG